MCFFNNGGIRRSLNERRDHLSDDDQFADITTRITLAYVNVCTRARMHVHVYTCKYVEHAFVFTVLRTVRFLSRRNIRTPDSVFALVCKKTKSRLSTETISFGNGRRRWQREAGDRRKIVRANDLTTGGS